MKKSLLMAVLVLAIFLFPIFVFAVGDVTYEEKTRFIGKWEGQWNASMVYSILDVSEITAVYSWNGIGFAGASEVKIEFKKDKRGIIMYFGSGPNFEFWLSDDGTLVGERKYPGTGIFTIEMKPVKEAN